jgi:peptidyl-prolyl cis-trans isomerase D
MSASMFELQLKNRELQKHLFDFIGAGTITPNFLIEKNFEENNKSLDIEYFDMKTLYKTKEDYSDNEIQEFINENKDQLKREYIDFKYVILNPKNLIGIEEFNQEFFDEIDSIENKISQGSTFDTILEDINVDIIEVNEFAPSSGKQLNEDLIYSKKASKIDLIESGDNFLLYNIDNQYDRAPDLNDEIIKGEIVELIYQKGKFDYNRKIIKEIQDKKFDNSKFEELAGYNKKYSSINSVEDNNIFDINSVKMLYAMPENSFALVNKEQNIFLVKITGSNKNSFNKEDEKYIKFVNTQNTNNRKSILQSYDQLLNTKYQVQLNQKTIDRLKNYFK